MDRGESATMGQFTAPLRTIAARIADCGAAGAKHRTKRAGNIASILVVLSFPIATLKHTHSGIQKDPRLE